jgi:NAD(P)-dependent dehydrogenase (short-subunit alcohol dehydrogenase family)
MELKLENKRVLVTGSSGGIGASIAQKFAGEGATVIVNGRRAEAAEAVAVSIREAGGKAIVAVGDLSTDEGVQKVLTEVGATVGGVDILVNNAAGGGHQNEMEAPAAEWLNTFNTNVLSMVRLIQKLLPAMQDQGWGRIINISSAASTKPSAGMGVYSVSKAAVDNLTVTLAQAMDNDNVTINTVSPGVVFTSGAAATFVEYGMAADFTEARAVMNKMAGDDVPFDRAADVDEIANVVVFLGSPLASYVHGANIRVDGGYVPTVN